MQPNRVRLRYLTREAILSMCYLEQGVGSNRMSRRRADHRPCWNWEPIRITKPLLFSRDGRRKGPNGLMRLIIHLETLKMELRKSNYPLITNLNFQIKRCRWEDRWSKRCAQFRAHIESLKHIILSRTSSTPTWRYGTKAKVMTQALENCATSMNAVFLILSFKNWVPHHRLSNNYRTPRRQWISNNQMTHA